MSELLDLLKRLETWSETPICALCGGIGPFHRHHKRFRSHGGTDRAENLVLLCEICHGAVHGIPVVKNGRSCHTCPVFARWGCFFGETVTGGPVLTPPPWDLDQT